MDLFESPRPLLTRLSAVLRVLCFPFGFFGHPLLAVAPSDHPVVKLPCLFVSTLALLALVLGAVLTCVAGRIAGRPTQPDPFEGDELWAVANPRRSESRRTGLTVMASRLYFRCDGCDCEFPATPDSFILTGPIRMAEEGEDLSPPGQELLTRHRLEALSDYELSERGLTQDDRQTLLHGGSVFRGADAFCPDCLRQIF